MNRSLSLAMCFGLAAWAAIPPWAAATASDADRCAAAKMKSAGRYAVCREKADAKAQLTATTPDYSKCDARQLSTWTRIEANFGANCPTSGDQADVQAAVTDFTACLSGNLVGTTDECDLATLQAELAACNSDLAVCHGLPCNTNLLGACSAGTTS